MQTNFLDDKLFTYAPNVLSMLKENKVNELLTQQLYNYRDKVDDASFHFLIGMCWLKKGMYHEAFIAFDKAQSLMGSKSHKGEIFKALTLYYAQKDQEAQTILGNIPLKELSVYEKLAFMSLSNSYGVDCAELLEDVLNAEYPSEADKIVMSVFAFVYSSHGNKANALALKLKPQMFKDIESYINTISELYKIRMRRFTIKKLTENVCKASILETLSPKEFMLLLKLISATNLNELVIYTQLETVIKRKVNSEKGKTQLPWLDVYTQFWSIALSLAESIPDEQWKKNIMSKIKKSKYKNEQALLILVTEEMKNVSEGNANIPSLKKRIEKLISFDQHNVKYRKIYADLAILLGKHEAADEIAKATIAMRKTEETAEYELLRAFYNFYGHSLCMFHDKEGHIQAFNDLDEKFDGEKCPWCFNSGYTPIIKTIGFAHSPANIFTEGTVEKKRIEVDEQTLQKMVDWVPMNVPSPLLNKYLHMLGAYMSPHEYPDVLVSGQTYIFIQLKTEAYKRLAQEGYSLSQIDPVWVASNSAKSARKELQIFSKEDKEIPADVYPITAKDLVVDVIHVVNEK